MKKALFIILIVLVACAQQAPTKTYNQATTEPATGTIYVALASDKQGIEIQINKVTIDNQAMEETPLKYRPERPAMIGSLTNTGGKYYEISIEVGNISINQQQAFTPTNTIKIPVQAEIIPNTQTAIILEIQQEESIYQGQDLIFAPVFRITTIKNARINLDPGRSMTATGTKESPVKMGMNEKGEISIGYSLPKTSEIKVQNNKLIITPVQINEAKKTPVSKRNARESTEIKMTIVDYHINPIMMMVRHGEPVILTVRSIDKEYGFYLEGYEIHQTIPPRKETTIKFTADKEGTFQYHCLNPCPGKEGRLWGKLIVRPSPQISEADE